MQQSLSADIVIESLLAFKNNGKFLLNQDLLDVVLRKVGGNTEVRFKIENLLLKCPGRTIAQFEIPDNSDRRVHFNEEKQLYVILFPYDVQLVTAIKAIPGRRYDTEKKYWTAPTGAEEFIKKFAKEHRFVLHINPKTRLSDNSHFTNYKQEAIPDGIIFCEGRQANKLDTLTQTEFWWCLNQSCYCNADKDRNNPKPGQTKDYYYASPMPDDEPKNAEVWETYVMLDFLGILGLNTDEYKTNPNDFVPDGLYYQFAGYLNRFNQLLKRLNCHECGNIMLPVRTGHFAYYNVVRFSCECADCSQYKKEVYLNHCFNNRCWSKGGNVVDSRVSKTCENGLYICDKCGSCCSHYIFDKRLQNLKHVGGYIHPDLIRKVETKAGHLERQEVYCHKCKNQMQDNENELYVCSNTSCDNAYDKTRMHFQIVGNFREQFRFYR